MQAAAAPSPTLSFNSSSSPSSLVLDYTLTGRLSNYTLQGGQTYLVSTGGVQLIGTTTIESGWVIKFVTGPDAGATISLEDTLVCKTAAGRPCIFTSRNDDSIGTSLSLSQTPTNYYQALDLGLVSGELRHVRISYADSAIHGYDIHLSQRVLRPHCARRLTPDTLLGSWVQSASRR